MNIIHLYNIIDITKFDLIFICNIYKSGSVDLNNIKQYLGKPLKSDVRRQKL